VEDDITRPGFQRTLDKVVVDRRVLEVTANAAVSNPLLVEMVKLNEQLTKEVAVQRRQIVGLQSRILRQPADPEAITATQVRETSRMRELEIGNSQLYAQHIADTQEIMSVRAQLQGYKEAHSAVVKTTVQGAQARAALGAMSNVQMELIRELSETLESISPQGCTRYRSGIVTEWMKLINSLEGKELEYDSARLNYTDLIRRYLELYHKVMVVNDATAHEQELFIAMEGQTGHGYPSVEHIGHTVESGIAYTTNNIRVGNTWVDNASERLYQIVRRNKQQPRPQDL
jgi:hypothetical protein